MKPAPESSELEAVRARTVDLFIMLCGNPDDSALGAETDRALAELDRLLTAPPGD